MPKISSLQALLKKASEKYEVPLTLLEEILDEERIRLYLFSSHRKSVMIDLRKKIQGEVQKSK